MKKETLEETAKEFCNNSASTNYQEGINVGKYQGFIQGAKWQKERSYSEEEVYKLLLKALLWVDNEEIGYLVTDQGEIRYSNFNHWFGKFKKK